MCIMAFNLHFPLALLLTLSISLTTTSVGSYKPVEIKEQEEDFRRWVSWNVENYRSRISAVDDVVRAPVLQAAGGRGTRMSTLDAKLVAAEGAKVRYIVSQDGTGDYNSIREAIASIPLKNKRRVILEIRPGTYREKIVIPKSMAFVTFLGSSGDPPLLTGNDTAATRGSDGKALNTFHSATVAVNSNYFVAANIRFENTAPYPDMGQDGGQAVALRISGDKAAFYNCSFYGTQDTLYDHKGLHYFNNCFIQGSVDFIFGYGRSLYENCYLNSIAKRAASLTAQKGTLKSIDSGFSFTKSTVNGSGLVYLGRAWGDHSRVVFSYTYMDRVVIPDGWDKWRVQRPEESGVYYGEYQCSGPGANWTGRVHWAHILTDDEAQPFLGTYYIYGDTWLMGPTMI